MIWPPSLAWALILTRGTEAVKIALASVTKFYLLRNSDISFKDVKASSLSQIFKLQTKRSTSEKGVKSYVS